VKNNYNGNIDVKYDYNLGTGKLFPCAASSLESNYYELSQK